MSSDRDLVRQSMSQALARNLYMRDIIIRWYDELAEHRRLVAEARAKNRDPKRSVLIERQMHLVSQLGYTVNGVAQIAVTGREPFADNSERGEDLRVLIGGVCLMLMAECEADPVRWRVCTREISEEKNPG